MRVSTKVWAWKIFNASVWLFFVPISENIAGRRSDNVNSGTVFDGTDDSKVTRPEVEASTGNEESELDADRGWGSGSSKTSDITSKVLLFCLILTLSHLLWLLTTMKTMI